MIEYSMEEFLRIYCAVITGVCANQSNPGFSCEMAEKAMIITAGMIEAMDEDKFRIVPNK